MFTKDSRRGDKFKKTARHFNVKVATEHLIDSDDYDRSNDKDQDQDKDKDKDQGKGRKVNKQIAEETCEILENKSYVYNDKVVNITIVEGETFDFRALNSIKKQPLPSLLSLPSINTSIPTSSNSSTLTETNFIVVRTTTVDAIHRFNNSDTKKLAVLSFASAKNPGGGFLKGSQAQEESLARATGVFATIKNSPMYEANETDNRKCLYHDSLIFSSNVPVFRSKEDELVETPVYVDIITVPAVNEREALKKGVSKALIDKTRFERMDSFLAVLASKNIKRILLGAWGCGVFGGSFPDLAQDYYSHFIEGKYKNVFEEVIFAVLDEDDMTLLEEYFLNCISS